MSLERGREREVHRYYQAWLESAAGFVASNHESTPSRFHPDGSALRASNDKSLTAFAQLGCLRLNAKRGIVTLISSSRQYVLAEATKSLSLISDLGAEQNDDELWFGNASFPRSQGISEAALDPPDYTTIGHDGKDYTVKALVVDDLTQHEQFSKFAFVGNGVTFYCGVPIISKAGHPIGVYTVSDDKPRDGLTAAELMFMQDMSVVVMRHLETIKNDAARFRGEKMIMGLSDFMRGKSSSNINLQPPPIYGSGVDSQSNRSVNGADIGRQFKGMTITNADPELLRHVQTSKTSMEPQNSNGNSLVQSDNSQTGQGNLVEFLQDPSQKQTTGAVPSSREENSEQPQISDSSQKRQSSMAGKIEHVFSRAAMILRECAAADGVVFFDASRLNAENASQMAGSKALENQIIEGSETSDESASDGQEYSSSGQSTDSDGSIDERSRTLKSRGRKCGLLGYALDISSSSTANVNTIKTLGLTERSLRHFIRRYPRGKSFYFDANGNATASEGEASDHLPSPRSKVSTTDRLERAVNSRVGGRSTKSIAEELIRVVPGARSVVWLPLWDFYKQRWCAGLFLWSQRSDRLLTAQDDMAYLKTFGNSIMIEVSRIDAQFADEAKATFIANISHELRSPLHGVLGSIEFLRETALDDFQSSMSLNIETCARTLLDTVEHVLDYAKINQTSTRLAKQVEPRTSNALTSGSAPERDVDLAQLFEKVTEAIYAGSTFRDPKYSKNSSPIAEAHNMASDPIQVTKENIQNGSSKFSGAVRIILNIEKQSNWCYRTQPGAISRIILNVLGNALKYTSKGYVMLSLAADKMKSKDPSKKVVCITVKDTGRGMSTSFLQNHAFMPFSQESQFSEGVGLGLSIVRQIAHSLAGRVDLKSTQGVGTEIQIMVALPIVENQSLTSGADSIFLTVMNKASGMTICMLNPKPENVSLAQSDASDEAVQDSICEIAETWFGMKTIRKSSMEGVVADFFFYAEPPPIDYLLQHHGHHARKSETPLVILTTNAFESARLTANGIHKLTDLGRIVEVISQPCGPHKLATTLHRCFTRLHDLATDPKGLSDASAVKLQVHESANPLFMSDGSQTPYDNDSNTKHAESPEAGMDREILDESDRSRCQASNPERNTLELDMDAGHTSQFATDSIAGQQEFSPIAGQISPASGNCKIPHPVLLVDDNEINLKLLVAFMRKAQFPYSTATNGLEAVQLYENASIDPKTAFSHVLMDVSMPVMNGIEATRKIRQHERRGETQKPATIITLTGLSQETTRKDIMEAGADHFLTKPVKFKELMHLIQAHGDGQH